MIAETTSTGARILIAMGGVVFLSGGLFFVWGGINFLMMAFATK